MTAILRPCRRPFAGTRIISSMRDTTTADLVAAASRGDQRAWGELVERYAGLVRAVARSFRLPDADVADVFQTVWLRFAEHIDRLRDPERAGAWLASTARNECIRLVRASGRVVVTDDFEDRPGDLGGVDQELLRAERRSELRAAFPHLSDPCRRLFSAFMTDPPPTYEEVSTRLGMPVGSIGPTRGRCLERLRRLLVASRTIDPTPSEAR